MILTKQNLQIIFWYLEKIALADIIICYRNDI